MGKPHPVELRERVVGFVKEGHTHRAAAARFRVSVRFVNDMVILKRETGSLAPKRQGHGGTNSKLRAHEDWVQQRLEENGELTLGVSQSKAGRLRGPEVAKTVCGHILRKKETKDGVVKWFVLK